MKAQKLSSTDGFIVWDIEEATTSVGVLRVAPKVLRDGAVLLARSVTYSFAAFGVPGHAGASAALNAKPDERDAAMGAFIEEVSPLVESGQLRLTPGLGVTAEDLAPLSPDEPDPAVLATGALAAAAAALKAGDGVLSGTKLAVVGTGPVAEATTAAAREAGAELTEARFDADAEVLLVAGKAGVLDHPTAETVQAQLVVPLTPAPVTARALAVLGRAGSVVVPDFLAVAAPLLKTYDPDGGEPTARIAEAVSASASDDQGLWLAAALQAEKNLATWSSEKPFGRPLA